MLTIATKRELKSVNKIKDVESRFRMLLNLGEKFELDIYTLIMKSIDLVNERKGNIIRNRFGETTLENLSTGCKAVILAVFYNKENIYVSIEECGENALDVLFKISERLDLRVYTRYVISVFKPDIKCRIGDNVCTGGYEIYRKLGELNELN